MDTTKIAIPDFDCTYIAPVPEWLHESTSDYPGPFDPDEDYAEGRIA